MWTWMNKKEVEFELIKYNNQYQIWMVKKCARNLNLKGEDHTVICKENWY